jgi:hypothetical protein
MAKQTIGSRSRDTDGEVYGMLHFADGRTARRSVN